MRTSTRTGDTRAIGHAHGHGPAHGRHPDVLVIGGGIIGLVTAWRAAQRGLRTEVVDPAPGGGAARVAAGMLAAVTELHYGEEALLRLNLAAARRYPAFAAELAEASGQDVGYRACGTLSAALDADDRAYLRELHALQLRHGLDSEWLSGRECRRLEPMLAPSVHGGLRVDGDHQVDPRRLAAALVTACERAGVGFRHASAVRLSVVRDRATGAVLDDGTERTAGRTVLAAGSYSGGLDGVPDALRPPVRPVKGQVVRLRVPPAYAPFLSRTVRAVVRGAHVYLVPRTDGELVIGATSEELGWDTTVTAGGVYELLRDAHELVPGVTELPLAETGAGLRPATPDNAPLLGPTGLAGLDVATGHYRNGVLLTPVTGDAMGELLATGELPELARPFTPGRFGAGAPRADGHTGGHTAEHAQARDRAGGTAGGTAGATLMTVTAHARITVNGEPREISAGFTLDRLVATLSTAPSGAPGAPGAPGVAAAVNEAVVPRGRWPGTPLADGDRVEILTAVQGG